MSSTRRHRAVAAAVSCAAVLAVLGTIAVATHLGREHAATTMSTAAAPLREDQAARAGADDRVPDGTATAEQARDQLPLLTVATPLTTPAYDRREFGTAWADGEGCDARDDVLADWVSAPVRNGRCDVVGGTLYDVYTARTLSSPRDADIDHVVSLGDAWRSGAAHWDRATRQRFATDRIHLIPVSASANRAKGDKPPNTWMPDSMEYHCEYGRVVVGTKTRYALTITAAEREALARALATC